MGDIYMIRSKLWFRCAAMHDPVSPVIVRPAAIGWEAKKRTVELTIDRGFSGEELVRRMKGWVTVDPRDVIDTVKKYGFMKVFEDNTLVVEFDRESDFNALEKEILEKYGSELSLEKISA